MDKEICLRAAQSGLDAATQVSDDRDLQLFFLLSDCFGLEQGQKLFLEINERLDEKEK